MMMMMALRSTLFFALFAISAFSYDLRKLNQLNNNIVMKMNNGDNLVIISNDAQKLLQNIQVKLENANKTYTAYDLSSGNDNGQLLLVPSNAATDFVTFSITNSDADQATLTGYALVQPSNINVYSIPQIKSEVRISTGTNLFYAPSSAASAKAAIAKSVKGTNVIGRTGVPSDTSSIIFFNSSLFDVASYEIVELPSDLFHFTTSDTQASFTVTMGDRISKTIPSLTYSGVIMTENFPTISTSTNTVYALQNPSNFNVVANIKPFFNSLITAYTANITIGTDADMKLFDCVSKYDTTIKSDRVTNKIVVSSGGPYSIQFSLQERNLYETTTKSSGTIQFFGALLSVIFMRF